MGSFAVLSSHACSVSDDLEPGISRDNKLQIRKGHSEDVAWWVSRTSHKTSTAGGLAAVRYLTVQ